MRSSRDTLRNCALYLVITLIPVLLAGCSLFSPQTDSTALQSADDPNRLRTDPLHVGDSVRVDSSGTPSPIPFVQTEIKGDGSIRLDLIGDVQFDGKTPGELEKIIQKKYVPDFYTHLNVTVTPVVRYFYVDGEINGGEDRPENGKAADLEQSREYDFIAGVLIEIGRRREAKSSHRCDGKTPSLKNSQAFGQLPPEINLSDVKGTDNDVDENIAPEKNLERSRQVPHAVGKSWREDRSLATRNHFE